MTKNIYNIQALLKKEQDPKSIQATSNQLAELLFGLSKIDSRFYSPVYIKQGFQNQSLDLKQLGVEKTKEKLSELILESNRSDIKIHDKMDSPDFGYSRNIGFSHLLNYDEEGEHLFSVTGNLGPNSYSYFNVEYFNFESEVRFSFEWYLAVLKFIVDTVNPLYAGVNLILTSFVDLYVELNVKDPFGWITYFANDYDVKIPDDLEGVEYEHTDKGKYIILTREDFSGSKEEYEVQRDKLLNLMKTVREDCPEYIFSK